MNAAALNAAEQAGEALLARGWTLAAAESCTGGGVGYYATEIAGASAWFLGGVMAYSNSVKQALLQVSETDLSVYGAVSEAVVVQMALGARSLLRSDCAVAISGIAGPAGASLDKPVGTVWLAWAWHHNDGSSHSHALRVQCAGNRQAVREQAVVLALRGVAQLGTRGAVDDVELAGSVYGV